MNRPESISLFGKVLLAAVVLQFIRMTLNWDAWAAISYNPAIQSSRSGSLVMIQGMVFATGLWLLLWYFIVHRASNVAKWIYVVVVILLIINTMLGASNPQTPKGLDKVIGLVILALQGFAGGLLFSNDAKIWLQSGGRGQ